MSDTLLENRNLIEPTLFKMLVFKPLLRTHVRTMFRAVYSNPLLSNAMVNVYPAMNDDPLDIHQRVCFMTFDTRKLANCIDAYKELVTQPGIQGIVENTEVEHLVVVVYQFPEKCDAALKHYIEGEYTAMFTKNQVYKMKKIFERQEGFGLPHKHGFSTGIYDPSMHILLFTEEYERYRAADIGFEYEQYKGRTKQHAPPPRIDDETLSINLLNKQYAV